MSDDPVSSAEQIKPSGDITIQGSVSGTGIAIGHGASVTIVAGPPPLSPEESARLLADYRARVLEETRYVNLRGIPLPRGRDGRPMPLQVPLEKVYICIQATTEKQRRTQEETEERSLSDRLRDESSAQSKRSAPGGLFGWLRGESKSESSPRDILSTLHTLGEYFYRRGEVYEAEQRPEPVDPQEALKKHKRLVVLGAPGAGKSTLLRYLARRAAEDSSGFVPIPVSLRDYATALAGDNALALSEFALRVASAGNSTLRQALEDEIKNGRVFWLVDALDEARGWATDAARQASQLPGQLILTSRPVGYVSTGLESLLHFEVLPLTPENVDEFLNSWFGLLAAQRALDDDWTTARVTWLKKQLEARPCIRALTRNPLLLTFLVILAGEDPLHDLPEQRSELYRRYVNELLDSWEIERRPKSGVEGKPAFTLGPLQGEQAQQMALQGFYYVGWALHLSYYGGKPKEPPTRNALNKTLTDYLKNDWGNDAHAIAEAVLEFWQEAGVLETWHLDGDDYLSFRHLTFQEYAAAWGLTAAWKQNSRRAWEFLRPCLHHYAWREPILLLVGLMEQKHLDSLAHRLLRGTSAYEGSLHRDLRLVGELLAEGATLDEEYHALHRLGKRPRQMLQFVLASLISGCLIMAPIELLLLLWPSMPTQVILLVTLLVFMVFWGSVLMIPCFPLIHSLLFLPTRLWKCIPDRVSLMSLFSRIGTRALPYLIQALHEDLSSDNVPEAAIHAMEDSNIRAPSYLIQDLRSRRRKLRQAAMKIIGYLGDAQVVPDLIQIAQDSDAEIRRIETARKKGIVRNLISATRLTILEMQTEAAIDTLGRLGSGQAVDSLVRILRESCSRSVRQSAAEALGKIGDAQAIPELSQHLQERSSDVREAVAEALGRMGLQSLPHLVPFLKHRVRDVRLDTIEALGKIDSAEVIPYLIQALQDSDRSVRLTAIRALTKIGDAQAVPHLLQASQDSDYNVSAAAITAIGQIGDAQAIPNLIRIWKDKQTDNLSFLLHSAIAQTLGKIGDIRAVPHLIQALQDNEAGQEAAKALGEIGDTQAVPYLIQVLQDLRYSNLRQAATGALGKIGGVESIPYLIPLLRDHDSNLRSAAVESINEIFIRQSQPLPKLIQALQNSDNFLLQTTVESMNKTGDEHTAPRITLALRGISRDIRQAAAEALGKIGDARAVPYLIRALRDSDSSVRSSAIRALGLIGDGQAIPHVTQNLWDRDFSVRMASAEFLKTAADKITDVKTGRYVARTLWWRLTEGLFFVSLASTFYQSLEQVANRLSVLEVEAMPLVDPLLPDPKRTKKR
ncbi:Phycocyanobilin lyase subunit alpha [Thermoflexales bacterium]|nr:Phycocyanobilin lyase subunit alpha [Thermoflexales bacterium]